MNTPTKSWVIIRDNAGRLKIWRDYGTAWGSPAYTVLGYFDGSRREALAYSRTL